MKLKMKYLVFLTELLLLLLLLFESKIPKISALVKKVDYDAEISEFKKRYFTTPDYNKFMNTILDANIIEQK